MLARTMQAVRLWRTADRSRFAQLPAVGVGLALAEAILVGQLGPPTDHLRVLRHLGDAWVNPVAGVIAAMALLAEILVAYVFVLVALRSLATVPGSIGRLATRVALLVTPVMVRRALDLLIGGTLLAQATVAITPAPAPGYHLGVAYAAQAVSSVDSNSDLPAVATSTGSGWATMLATAVTRIEPAETRPAPRRASAPLPPWLGGGPSNPTPGPVDSRPHGLDETPDPGNTPGLTDEPGPSDTPGPGYTPGPGDASGPGEPDNLDPPGPGDRPDVEGGKSPPAEAAGPYVVEAQDTLWDIAAARMRPTARSNGNVHRYWQQVYRVNRSVIGDNPDLIHPGMRLDVPPYRPDRR